MDAKLLLNHKKEELSDVRLLSFFSIIILTLFCVVKVSFMVKVVVVCLLISVILYWFYKELQINRETIEIYPDKIRCTNFLKQTKEIYLSEIMAIYSYLTVINHCFFFIDCDGKVLVKVPKNMTNTNKLIPYFEDLKSWNGVIYKKVMTKKIYKPEEKLVIKPNRMWKSFDYTLWCIVLLGIICFIYGVNEIVRGYKKDGIVLALCSLVYIYLYALASIVSLLNNDAKKYYKEMKIELTPKTITICVPEEINRSIAFSDLIDIKHRIQRGYKNAHYYLEFYISNNEIISVYLWRDEGSYTNVSSVSNWFTYYTIFNQFQEKEA